VLTSGGGPTLRSVAVSRANPESLVVVPGHDGTASIALPAALPFSTFTPEPGYLALSGSGPTPDSPACLVGTLDLSATRLTDVDELAESPDILDETECGAGAGLPMAVSILGGQGNVTIRVMTAIRDRQPVYGPPLFTYNICSTCDPSSVAADGSIWVFSPGPEARVFRVSPTTGRVLNTIPIAGGSYRPIIAADDDGVWMTFPANGSYGARLPADETPLIHIAPGSNVAEVHILPGYSSEWMLAEDHTLWLETQDPLGAGVASVFRFDGPNATERFRTTVTNPAIKNAEGALDGAVIGNAAQGLWCVLTVTPPYRLGGPKLALGLDVVRIDPATGRERVVTELHPVDLPVYETVGPRNIGIDGRDLYVLVAPNTPPETSPISATLYRVAM
jgi:hypothetical protein